MPVTIGGSGPITGVTSINTTVSDTELGYLDGVTSALQTQINSKPTGDTGAWTAFTPSWTNLTVGNATNSGRWSQVGKTVFVHIQFIWGSTTSASNIFYPVMPTGAASEVTGYGWIYDTSAGAFQSCILRGGNYIITPTAGRANATVPWTWATGDYVFLFATYEAN